MRGHLRRRFDDVVDRGPEREPAFIIGSLLDADDEDTIIATVFSALGERGRRSTEFRDTGTILAILDSLHPDPNVARTLLSHDLLLQGMMYGHVGKLKRRANVLMALLGLDPSTLLSMPCEQLQGMMGRKTGNLLRALTIRDNEDLPIDVNYANVMLKLGLISHDERQRWRTIVNSQSGFERMHGISHELFLKVQPITSIEFDERMWNIGCDGVGLPIMTLFAPAMIPRHLP